MSFADAYDLVVVGGGLLGAGIARDAAQRGLSVALFEAEDFGAGAVSRGSRLLLGGLGALGTLDFTRVREDIREREILLQTAPHLVRPLACLVPFYSHGLLAQTRLRAGLALADALGFDHALRVHQLLSAKAAQKRAPGLRPEGLLGAALVWEAEVSSVERLARELAQDARRYGAVLHPHAEVEALCREPGRAGRERVSGVLWKDTLSRATGRTHASLVVLAAGTGSDALRERSPQERTKIVSVTLSLLPGMRDALVFPQEDAPALLLAVPGPGICWAGSITADYHDGDAAYATGAEVAALSLAMQAYLPDFQPAAIRRADAALHASVVPGQEVEDAGANGGRCDGLVAVSGAGLTRFRRAAEDAVDLACRKLGRALSVPRCRTATTPLPEPRVCPAEGVKGRAAFAAAEEDCLTLRDFLERRLPLGWTADQKQSEMPAALEALAAVLGWDAARQATEVKAWEAENALGQAFRVL